MANGSVANGKAKSPTPASNPIGECFCVSAFVFLWRILKKTSPTPASNQYIGKCFQFVCTCSFEEYQIKHRQPLPPNLLVSVSWFTNVWWTFYVSTLLTLIEAANQLYLLDFVSCSISKDLISLFSSCDSSQCSSTTLRTLLSKTRPSKSPEFIFTLFIFQLIDIVIENQI